MMTDTGVPRFYRTGEVARLFGVSRPTIWRWKATGRLPEPVMDPGGNYMWPADELDAMVEAGTDRLIAALEGDEPPADSG